MRKTWKATKQREARINSRRFLLGAAIGAATTAGLVGLVCLCIYRWAAGELEGPTSNALPTFTAWFVSVAPMLVLGAIVINVTLAALLCRFAGKIAAVVVSLFVASAVSCLLVGLTGIWYAWTPWPSPQPYPGVETQCQFEPYGNFANCNSCTYEVDLSLPLALQYYEQEMKQYCIPGTWGFAATPESSYTCYEATCDIPKKGAMQWFTVHICPVDSTRTNVVHQDCMED